MQLHVISADETYTPRFKESERETRYPGHSARTSYEQHQQQQFTQLHQPGQQQQQHDHQVILQQHQEQQQQHIRPQQQQQQVAQHQAEQQQQQAGQQQQQHTIMASRQPVQQPLKNYIRRWLGGGDRGSMLRNKQESRTLRAPAHRTLGSEKEVSSRSSIAVDDNLGGQDVANITDKRQLQERKFLASLPRSSDSSAASRERSKSFEKAGDQHTRGETMYKKDKHNNSLRYSSSDEELTSLVHSHAYRDTTSAEEDKSLSSAYNKKQKKDHQGEGEGEEKGIVQKKEGGPTTIQEGKSRIAVIPRPSFQKGIDDRSKDERAFEKKLHEDIKEERRDKIMHRKDEEETAVEKERRVSSGNHAGKGDTEYNVHDQPLEATTNTTPDISGERGHHIGAIGPASVLRRKARNFDLRMKNRRTQKEHEDPDETLRLAATSRPRRTLYNIYQHIRT